MSRQWNMEWPAGLGDDQDDVTKALREGRISEVTAARILEQNAAANRHVYAHSNQHVSQRAHEAIGRSTATRPMSSHICA